LRSRSPSVVLFVRGLPSTWVCVVSVGSVCHSDLNATVNCRVLPALLVAFAISCSTRLPKDLCPYCLCLRLPIGSSEGRSSLSLVTVDLRLR